MKDKPTILGKVIGWLLLTHIFPLFFLLPDFADENPMMGYLVGWMVNIVVAALFGLVNLILYLIFS